MLVFQHFDLNDFNDKYVQKENSPLSENAMKYPKNQALMKQKSDKTSWLHVIHCRTGAVGFFLFFFLGGVGG